MSSRHCLDPEMNWYLDLRFHRMRQLQRILSREGITLPDAPVPPSRFRIFRKRIIGNCG